MSKYIAEQIFGEGAFYGLIRMAFCHAKEVDGHSRLWGGYSLVMPEPCGLPDSGEWQINDAEIFVRPIRNEKFRGMKGMRVDQVLSDHHFKMPFGNCANDHGECYSCDEKKLKYDKTDRTA